MQRADRLFLEGYSQLARQKRSLLLFDTMEAVQRTDMWRCYLLDIAGQLKNTMLILAGQGGWDTARVGESVGQAILRMAHVYLCFDDEILQYLAIAAAHGAKSKCYVKRPCEIVMPVGDEIR